METEDRAYKLTRSLRKIDHSIWKTNDSILKGTGLSHSEIDVLFTVYHYNRHNSDAITASKVANLMDVTLPAIMHKLTILENEGYVVRSSSEVDKRKKFINITSKWLNIIKEIDNHEEGIITDFLETLPGKGEMLARVLDDFAKYLEGILEKNV